LCCLKTPDYSYPWAEDKKKEIEPFVPQSYIESLEFSYFFGEHILCLINTANPDKIMTLDVTYTEDEDETKDTPDDNEADLIHHFQRTLKALHTCINTLNARVHHNITSFDVYSLIGIDKCIAYLKEEIHILEGLGQTTGHTNQTHIKWCTARTRSSTSSKKDSNKNPQANEFIETNYLKLLQRPIWERNKGSTGWRGVFPGNSEPRNCKQGCSGSPGHIDRPGSWQPCTSTGV
jgi:hypothetical protein